MSPEEPKDVEVPEAPAAEETAPPTLADLAKGGFEPQEVEMAKKLGLAKSKGENDGDNGNGAGDASNKGKDDESALDDGADRRTESRKTDDDGETKEKEKKTVDERYRILAEGRSPEAIMEEMQEKGIELSPEQENILIAALTHNGKTLYWAQKKSRLRAQKAESESIEHAKEIEQAKARIAELEKRPATAKTAEDDLLNLDGEPEKEVDPKKKPLTMEDLDRIDAEKKAKADEEAKARTGRAAVIHEALEDQQADARERYTDFDQSLGFVNDILARANSGTLKEIYPDARQQTRIIMKARTLLTAFANADKFDSNQFNAADLAYELGKEHPEYGKKKPNASGLKPGETDVDGNPEDVRRAVQNANRRGSSATLNGGGSRRVALEELTPDQASRLTDAQFRKLPKAVRERLLSA